MRELTLVTGKHFEGIILVPTLSSMVRSLTGLQMINSKGAPTIKSRVVTNIRAHAKINENKEPLKRKRQVDKFVMKFVIKD